MAHTPGPWRYGVLSNLTATPTPIGFDIIASDGPFIASTALDREDDARLITAAPELLDALKVARRVLEVACGTTAPYICEALKITDHAIAKAEGR